MSGHHSHRMNQRSSYTTEEESSSSNRRSPLTARTSPKQNRHRSWSRSRSRSPRRKREESPYRGRKERSRSPQKQGKERIEQPRKQFKEKKNSIVDAFVKYKAKHNTDQSFCGFHWHSWRLAKKGTDRVFDEMKAEFQIRCRDGKIEWPDAREMLFKFKKAIDKDYRSMLWHFRFTECTKCDFWDDVYKKHMANVHHEPPQELTDEELLAALQEAEAGK